MGQRKKTLLRQSYAEGRAIPYAWIEAHGQEMRFRREIQQSLMMLRGATPQYQVGSWLPLRRDGCGGRR
jgi:hypothetical protein